MSKPFNRNEIDPLSLVPFSEALLDEVTAAARESQRRRSILRFHAHEERLQRMLNAVEPETYARPHRHVDPARPEVLVVLRGSVLAVRFDDAGTPLEGILASADGPVKGLEIPPGAWHTLLSLEPGTVLFEVTQGPYDSSAHKDFAPWAPPEEDRQAGLAFMGQIRSHFEPLIPGLATLYELQAEEEDLC
jgi:cupin fold WbuC family metalloprotein